MLDLILMNVDENFDIGEKFNCFGSKIHQLIKRCFAYVNFK